MPALVLLLPGSASCRPDFADLYASVLGRSLTIDDLFLRMQAAVKRELQFEEELFQLQGCLDLILSSAQ